MTLYVLFIAAITMTAAVVSSDMMDRVTALTPHRAQYMKFAAAVREFRPQIENIQLPATNSQLVPQLAATFRVLLEQADGITPFGDYSLRYAAVVSHLLQQEDGNEPKDLSKFRRFVDHRLCKAVRRILFEEPRNSDNAAILEGVNDIMTALGVSESAALLLIAARVMVVKPTRNPVNWVRSHIPRSQPDFPVSYRGMFSLPTPVEAMFFSHFLRFWKLLPVRSDSNGMRRGSESGLDAFKAVLPLLYADADVKLALDQIPEMSDAPMGLAKDIEKHFRSLVEPLLGAPLSRRERDLRQEYKSIPNMALERATEARPDLNRYNGLSAGPHRVVLQKESDTDVDYINADLIPAISDAGTDFIATQAPMPNTFGDFWQMIWQQNTRMVVMLANLKEGPTRVNQYWPERGETMRLENGYQVRLTKSEDHGDFIVRTFELGRRSDSSADLETRTVTQIQYLAWPDFGVPQMDSFIGMYNKFALRRYVINSEMHSEAINPGSPASQTAGPVVVHCSAGIGRTGTFIAIFMAVTEARRAFQIRAEAPISPSTAAVPIPEIVKHIRNYRSHAVAGEDQYAFIYAAVMEKLFGRQIF